VSSQTFLACYAPIVMSYVYFKTRTHNCGLEPETEVGQCNTSPGVYLPWGNWGDCSATCQGGQRVRIRRHNCGLPDDAASEV